MQGKSSFIKTNVSRKQFLSFKYNWVYEFWTNSNYIEQSRLVYQDVLCTNFLEKKYVILLKLPYKYRLRTIPYIRWDGPPTFLSSSFLFDILTVFDNKSNRADVILSLIICAPFLLFKYVWKYLRTIKIH